MFEANGAFAWEFVCAGDDLLESALDASQMADRILIDNTESKRIEFIEQLNLLVKWDTAVKRALDIVQIADIGRCEHRDLPRERMIRELSRNCCCSWQPAGDLCIFVMYPHAIPSLTKQPCAVAFHVETKIWVAWTWPVILQNKPRQSGKHVAIAHTFREITYDKGVESPNNRMVVDIVFPVYWNGERKHPTAMKDWFASCYRQISAFDPLNRALNDKCELTSLELHSQIQDSLPLVWLVRPMVGWEDLSLILESAVVHTLANHWTEGNLGSRSTSSIFTDTTIASHDQRRRSLCSKQWKVVIPHRRFYKQRATREIVVPLTGLLFKQHTSDRLCEWIREPTAMLVFNPQVQLSTADPLKGALVDWYNAADKPWAEFEKNSAMTIRKYCSDRQIQEPIRVECVFAGCWILTRTWNVMSKAGRVPARTSDVIRLVANMHNTLSLAEVYELVRGQALCDRERSFLSKYESPISLTYSRLRNVLPTETMPCETSYEKKTPDTKATSDTQVCIEIDIRDKRGDRQGRKEQMDHNHNTMLVAADRDSKRRRCKQPSKAKAKSSEEGQTAKMTWTSKRKHKRMHEKDEVPDIAVDMSCSIDPFVANQVKERSLSEHQVTHVADERKSILPVLRELCAGRNE